MVLVPSFQLLNFILWCSVSVCDKTSRICCQKLHYNQKDKEDTLWRTYYPSWEESVMDVVSPHTVYFTLSVQLMYPLLQAAAVKGEESAPLLQTWERGGIQSSARHKFSVFWMKSMCWYTGFYLQGAAGKALLLMAMFSFAKGKMNIIFLPWDVSCCSLFNH